MEVCIFSQICANGAALFELRVGEPFECELSRAGFLELQALLLAEPDWGAPRGGGGST